MSDIRTQVISQDGQIIFNRIQDCTPIAEQSKRLHIEGFHGSNEMRHAARFPMVIVEKYMTDSGITFEEFLKDKTHARRMLNDPALAHFRVWDGNV